MKFLRAIIPILLLPVSVYAVSMAGSIQIYAPLVITVNANMTLPSVYTDTTGTVTSEDTSSIPGGTDGVNAAIGITGEVSKQYSLVFNASTTITNGTDNLTVNLSMGTGGGNKTGRTLSGGGTDSTTIKGSVTLSGTRSRGAYSGSFAVTASYDAV
ncbi:MAG: DUF4402 domain-containing protein [Pseudomonadota bacterium]